MVLSDECWVKHSCAKYKKCSELCDSNVFCEKLSRLEMLYNGALLTPAQRVYKTLYPDANGIDNNAFNFLKNIEVDIENWVHSNQSLYIYSEYPGNGKTSWSIRLLQSYINCVWFKSIEPQVLFINVPRFLIELKNNISKPSEYIEHIQKYINSVDVVVWDDIGTKNGTSYEIESMYSMINYRMDLGKCNIYTSNVSPSDLGNLLGERLASRICTSSACVHLQGADKRGLHL